MTKRNPIPPGAENRYYTTQRCGCGRPYITNIPPTPRPTTEREPMEPDSSVPPALDKHGESRYDGKANNALNWFFFLALAFAMGAFCAMVALSKWP